MRSTLRLGGLVLGSLLVLLQANAALACSGSSAGTLADVFREADAIALVTVIDRVDGEGRWSYELKVDQVIKGELGPVWEIADAGASDCGMPTLDVGERWLIEYWVPGRIVDTPEPMPWFFAWEVSSDGSIRPTANHDPSPKTLVALLSAFGQLRTPDTSAAPKPEESSDVRGLIIVLAALTALGVSLGVGPQNRPSGPSKSSEIPDAKRT